MLSGILAYQALYGYVYEMIGILSAAFMLGLWIGTVLIKRTRSALKKLLYLELIAIALSVAAPLFFRAEFLFYALFLVSGTLTGGLFGTANLAMGDNEASGKLYGLDLAGSFLGSFIPSMLIVPLFGVSQALLFVSLVKTFSALMVLSCLKGSGNFAART